MLLDFSTSPPWSSATDVLEFCSASELSVNLNKIWTAEAPSLELLITEISPTSGRIYGRQKAYRNHVSYDRSFSRAPTVLHRVRENTVLETWPAFRFQRREGVPLQIICKLRESHLAKKGGFYFLRHQTHDGKHLAVFPSGSHFLPSRGGLCTQGSFLCDEAGSWGVSCPGGAAAYVSRTQEVPRFGGGNWNSGLGARLPNILGQHNRNSMSICVCVFLLRETHGQIISQRHLIFLEHSGKSDLCLFVQRAVWFKCTPSQGSTLPCKTQTRMSIFPLFFWP